MKTRGSVLEARRYAGSVTPPAALEDVSRFGNDGVFTNITQVRLPSGLWVTEFNGTTSLITVAAGRSHSVGYLNPHVFSLEAWINANSDGENNEGRIFSKALGYELWIDSETAAGCLIEATVDMATDANAVTSARVRIGAWGHIVAVFNRLGTYHYEIYLNGSLLALGTDTAGIGAFVDDTANALIIGNNVATDRTFDGEIVIPRIYNYALTAGEIAAKFEAGRHWFGVN